MSCLERLESTNYCSWGCLFGDVWCYFRNSILVRFALEANPRALPFWFLNGMLKRILKHWGPLSGWVSCACFLTQPDLIKIPFVSFVMVWFCSWVSQTNQEPIGHAFQSGQWVFLLGLKSQRKRQRECVIGGCSDVGVFSSVFWICKVFIGSCLVIQVFSCFWCFSQCMAFSNSLFEESDGVIRLRVRRELEMQYIASIINLQIRWVDGLWNFCWWKTVDGWKTVGIPELTNLSCVATVAAKKVFKTSIGGLTLKTGLVSRLVVWQPGRFSFLLGALPVRSKQGWLPLQLWPWTWCCHLPALWSPRKPLSQSRQRGGPEDFFWGGTSLAKEMTKD